MATPLDPNDLVTLEELTISNMWEVAALIEVWEKKGLISKQDILTEIRELRKMNPTARTPLELDNPSAKAERHSGGVEYRLVLRGTAATPRQGSSPPLVPWSQSVLFCEDSPPYIGSTHTPAGPRA